MAFVVIMEYTALYCPEPHEAKHKSQFLYFCIIIARLRALNLQSHYVLSNFGMSMKGLVYHPLFQVKTVKKH